MKYVKKFYLALQLVKNFWPQFLARKNGGLSKPYIIPNRWGLLLLGVSVLVLLMGSIYGNNLVNLLGYLLLSFLILAAALTSQNIKGIKLHSLNVRSNYLGQTFKIEIHLKNDSLKSRDFLKLDAKNKSVAHSAIFRLLPQELKVISLTAQFNERGQYQLPRLRLSSEYPFGIFYTWLTIDRAIDFYVYPRPQGQIEFPLYSNKHFSDQLLKVNSAPEDFFQLRPWQQGESLARVDWKGVAKGRAPLVKEFGDSFKGSVQIRWQNLLWLEPEQRLSQISLWTREAAKQKLKIECESYDGLNYQGDPLRGYDNILNHISTAPKGDWP